MNERQIWLNLGRCVLLIVLFSVFYLLPPSVQNDWSPIHTKEVYALSNNVTGSDVYAAWCFDNDATDDIGSNDLTEDNSPIYSTSGIKEGTHLIWFVGSDNTSAHINDADLDAGFPGKDGVSEQDFTMTAWVKATATGYFDIVGKYDQTNDERSWRFYLNNNKFEFTVGHTNGADNTTIQWSTTVSTSKRYHVACSYNATDNYMKLRVWDDTTKAVVNTTGTAGADMSSSNATLWFGSTNQIDTGTDNTMTGQLDEVLVFNSFLSDDDIDDVRSGVYQRSNTPEIDTVYDNRQVRIPAQRGCFYAESLHWVFYSKGGYFYYSTSSDNSTWATPTQVEGLGYDEVAACFDISFNGTHIHYIRNTANGVTGYEGIAFRVGVPQSDGSISWVDSEQTVFSDSVVANDISLALDSEGYPWIASNNGTDTDIVSVVTSTTNDGTWSANSSYPQDLVSGEGGMVMGLMIPQTNKKMVCLIYTTSGTPDTIRARSFDGSSWGAIEDVTNEVMGTYTSGGYYGQLCATSIGDTIHFVMSENNTRNLQYYSGSEGSWSSNTTLYTANSTKTTAVIAAHGDDQLCVFWVDNDYHIYYRHYNGSTWETTVDWLNAESYLFLPNTKPNNQCFYESNDSIIGLSYMIDPGSDQTLYGIGYIALNTTEAGWDASGWSAGSFIGIAYSSISTIIGVARASIASVIGQ